jgi:glycerol-3-phosphate dehydrogenase
MEGFTELLQKVRARYPFLGPDQSERMLRAYGTCLYDILGDAKSTADLGKDFGEGLYESEVRYLMDHEWARTADDILWRRSKIGIGMNQQQINALDRWMEVHASPTPNQNKP